MTLTALAMVLVMISVAVRLATTPAARRGKRAVSEATLFCGAAIIFALAVYDLATT